MVRRQSKPVLAGVAGPDGSGKSALAARLGRGHALGGRPAAVLHLYGCVICRRWRGHPLSAGVYGDEDRAAGPVRRGLRWLHALVDAAEMSALLLAAVLWGWSAGTGPIITDRTPLDALVKHDPGPRSLAGRWYLALARSYGTLLWLDAEPTTLAARDGEHSAAELVIVRERFQRWARRLPNIVRLDTDAAAPDEILKRSASAAGLRRSGPPTGADDHG